MLYNDAVIMLVMGGFYWTYTKTLLGKATAKSTSIGAIVAGLIILFLSAYTTVNSGFPSRSMLIQAAGFGIFGVFFLWYGIESRIGGDLQGLGWFLQFGAITTFVSSILLVDSIGQTAALYWLSWGLLLYLLHMIYSKSLDDPRLTKLTAYLMALISLMTMWVPAFLTLAGQFYL